MYETRPTERATKFNEPLAHAATSDILGDNIQQVGAKSGQAATFRITIGIKVGGTDSIFFLKTNDGTTDLLFEFNSGTALEAGKIYTFVHATRGEHFYNYQFADETDIGILYVEEVTNEAL